MATDIATGTCTPALVGNENTGYRAVCRIHDYATADVYYDRAHAGRIFRCDEGTRRRYIVEIDDAAPSMTDGTGLADALLRFVEAQQYGQDVREIRAWEWRDGAAHRMATYPAEISEWNGDDYRTVTWVTVDSDRKAHARVSVVHDGRA